MGTIMAHFKGKQFKQDIIMVAVGYYLQYNLSSRDVSEILPERRIGVCHTTVYRWVQEYSQIAYYLWENEIARQAILGEWMKPTLK
ncbi:hypothetical protein IGI43_002220 [Enterococcus sp. AZ126]